MCFMLTLISIKGLLKYWNYSFVKVLIIKQDYKLRITSAAVY
jgi:hypothetical protein